MNIRELKELIKDLPDETPVMEAHSDPVYFGVFGIVDFSVETVWEHKLPPNKYTGDRGHLNWIEEHLVPHPRVEYKALVYKTEY